MKHKWKEDKLWKFQEMYEDPDISIAEISEYFNIKKNTIYSIAYENNIKRGLYSDLGYMKCYKCKSVLTLDNFYKNKSNKNGVNDICKECTAKSKGYKRKNRVFTKEEKDYIIKSYSKPTTDLGELCESLDITKDQLKNFIRRQRAKGVNIRHRIGRRK